MNKMKFTHTHRRDFLWPHPDTYKTPLRQSRSFLLFRFPESREPFSYAFSAFGKGEFVHAAVTAYDDDFRGCCEGEECLGWGREGEMSKRPFRGEVFWEGEIWGKE